MICEYNWENPSAIALIIQSSGMTSRENRRHCANFSSQLLTTTKEDTTFVIPLLYTRLFGFNEIWCVSSHTYYRRANNRNRIINQWWAQRTATTNIEFASNCRIIAPFVSRPSFFYCHRMSSGATRRHQ